MALVGRVFVDQYGLRVGDRFTIPRSRATLEDQPRPDVKIGDLTLEVVGVFQDRTTDLLRDEFGIAHATIQVEPETHQQCVDTSW